MGIRSVESQAIIQASRGSEPDSYLALIGLNSVMGGELDRVCLSYYGDRLGTLFYTAIRRGDANPAIIL